MKVFVLVKTSNKRKIIEIFAISEDKTKKFRVKIGECPHRLLLIKAFEEFEKFCTLECGMKDKTDEVCIISYTRELSGDVFDFDTFLLGRDWCTPKSCDSSANKISQYIADLQGE